MPQHDYLHHQRRRRSSAATWRFFHSPPGLADIATSGRGRVTDFARGPSRAPNTSYWLTRQYDAETEVVQGEPIPEELLRHSVPSRAPGASRTANQTYWRDNQPQIGDEVIGMPVSQIPERAPGYRRTAPEIYWRHNAPQITDEVAGMPVWLIPDRAPGARRAAVTAYDQKWTALSPQINDEVPGMRLWEVADFARDAARAANHVYWIGLKPPVPELEFEELKKTSITDFARGAARASNTEYSVLRSPQITDEVAGMPVWNIPEFARGPARTANTAYFLSRIAEDFVAEIPPEPVPEEIQRFITDFARGPRRTSQTAYLVNLTFPPGIADVATAGRGAVTLFARGPRRATADQYWRDNVNTPPVPGEIAGLRLFEITDFARPKPRAANGVYWLPSPVEIPDLPPLPAGQLFPDLARGSKRAANEVYFVLTKAPVADVIQAQVVGRGFTTHFAPRKQPKPRAANAAYWRDNLRQLDDGCIFVCLDGFQIDKRAVNTAYQFPYPIIITDVESAVLQKVLLPHRIERVKAPNSIYWQRNAVQITDEVPTNDRINEYFRGLPRAPEAIYWHDFIPQIGDEPPTNDRLFEPRLIARRAPNGEYWIGLLPIVSGEVQHNTRIFEPHLIPLRAAPSIYWNDNRLAVETLEFPIELLFNQFIPMRADGRQRAANTQYEFRLPPFEVPPDVIRTSRKYFVHSTYRKRGRG